MSRIGKLPIQIPQGVTVNIDNNLVKIKGPLGELEQKVNDDLKIEINDANEMIIDRPSDAIEHKAMHGLYRSLLNNMVIGVSEGFSAQLELVGVGFKAENNGQVIDFSLGYSHHIFFEMPKEIQVECKTEKRANTIITLKSFDKQLLGHVVAKIRSLRPIEPYKGKGIRFVGEEIRKKAGKSASV
ncbi:MAG: 50S ribosomal protein L6 [Bacteroidia bacterium]|nr:MAG: 50S ribosomal protein L6 [Bacteroidia bacterium]